MIYGNNKNKKVQTPENSDIIDYYVVTFNYVNDINEHGEVVYLAPPYDVKHAKRLASRHFLFWYKKARKLPINDKVINFDLRSKNDTKRNFR